MNLSTYFLRKNAFSAFSSNTDLNNRFRSYLKLNYNYNMKKEGRYIKVHLKIPPDIILEVKAVKIYNLSDKPHRI